jgi:hypothetical protein
MDEELALPEALLSLSYAEKRKLLDFKRQHNAVSLLFFYFWMTDFDHQWPFLMCIGGMGRGNLSSNRSCG